MTNEGLKESENIPIGEQISSTRWSHKKQFPLLQIVPS